jgi:hypothetical protein
MNEHVEAMYENLANVAPSLHASLRSIEQELERRRAEVEALTKARVEAQRILRLIDPDYKPEVKTKRKPKGNSAGNHSVSEETQEKVLDWLRQGMNGNLFTARDLGEAESFTFLSGSRINDVLNALHERGLIRLDHVGGTKGKTRFWQVTHAE